MKPPPSPLPPLLTERKPRRQSLGELRDLQRLTAKMVMRPLGPGWNADKKWGDGRRAADVAAGFVKPNDRLTSLERVEIYNRQYWYRLIDCLYEDYPGLLAVIGKAKFDRLTRAYIESCPSRSFTLRNLGGQLEGFIARRPQYVRPRAKLARQMAAFEWAQVVAFDGPEERALAVADVRGANPPKLRLRLQPHVTVLKLDYPLDDYSLALKEKNSALRAEASNAIGRAPEVEAARRVGMPRPQRVFVVVHRQAGDLYYKRLEAEAYRLLTALRDGATVAEACAGVMRGVDGGEAAGRIRAWFANWASLGWLCKRATGA